MSRLVTLHLSDLEAQPDQKLESGRNRIVATILTAGIVVLGGSALFLLMGDDPPRQLPSESEAGGLPYSDASSAAAPVDSAVATTPEQVGTVPSAVPEVAKVATLTAPAGTKLMLEIAEPLPSEGAVVGTEIVAKLATALEVDGEVAVAAGSRVVGRVTEMATVDGEDGSAIVGVVFDRIEADGEPTQIAAALQGVRLDLAPGRLLELELSDAVEFPVAAEHAG